MKLYEIAQCPFAHRARIVLEEKKLQYDVVTYEAKNRPPELAAVSPDAKSPTLFDDGDDVVVWESLVVCEYLDERYPEPKLSPVDAIGRARARLAMREVESKLAPILGPIVQEVAVKAAADRDENKVHEAIAKYRDALATWEKRLQGKSFLLGDTFTLADVTLFTPVFAVARLLGKDGDVPDAFTHLRAWRDRVASRPSVAP